MASIAPFQALRYDPARVTLSQVVTQPYDKITPAMRESYCGASPYNLVRIILGKPEPGDDQRNNVYTRATHFFADWRRQGVFFQDPHPSFYAYVQRFTLPGEKTELQRHGFIALGRVEDYSAGIVFRHEQTLAKPKADRLDLLRATRAHFGQIFMLYSDPAGEIDRLLATEAAPDSEVEDEYSVSHRLWKISDPGVVGLIRSKMQDKKLIIADGHHRYETALDYRDERRAQAGSKTGDAPYEWVMMTFVNMDSPGLTILPAHRVVHGLASFSSGDLRDKARAYFRVEEVNPALDGLRATSLLCEAGRGGTALLAVSSNRAFLLDQRKSTDSNLLAGFSERQRALDVVQLHKCLLEGVLGLSEESIRNQQNISYARDAEEALQRVHSGKANVAFLMNPVRMDQVRDIAFAGELLPQKSTDFYPKLLSGLTIYALE